MLLYGRGLGSNKQLQITSQIGKQCKPVQVHSFLKFLSLVKIQKLLVGATSPIPFEHHLKMMATRSYRTLIIMRKTIGSSVPVVFLIENEPGRQQLSRSLSVFRRILFCYPIEKSIYFFKIAVIQLPHFLTKR